MTLGACAHKKISQPDPFFEKWQKKAQDGAPHLPKDRNFNTKTTEANPPIPPHSPVHDKAVTSKRETLIASLPHEDISVRFVGDSLPAVLRTLARLAKVNILISPSVQGELNTQIENTPWSTVFMGIIDTYGLVVKRENNLLHVMSFKDMEQQLARKSLQMEESQLVPLSTRMVPIEYSNPNEVADSLRLLLSHDKKGKVRGSISVDSHSRSVIIRESAENMSKLLNLIGELDKPTPQILIKAHIIETSKDMARELGVEWNAQSRQNGDFSFNSGGSFPVQGGATLGLLAQGGSLTLDMQLSALQEDGKINILSSPSIATLDNNQAVIESGTSIPYPTGVDINGNASFSTQEATLKLTVTPHVISDKMIKLDIKTKKDEVDPTRDLGGTPYILRKNASTNLIVENNSTVVIAGLTKETSAVRDSGVPLLKDVPFFGYLFKNDSDSNKFEDLLIFITPTILNQNK